MAVRVVENNGIMIAINLSNKPCILCIKPITNPHINMEVQGVAVGTFF